MRRKGKILFFCILAAAGMLLLAVVLLGAYAWVRMGAKIDGHAFPDGEFHAEGKFRNAEPVSDYLKKIRNAKPAVDHLKKFSRAAGFFRYLFVSPNRPPHPLPTVKPDFSQPPGDYKVTWFGHSTLMLELSGKRILIDPVFGNAAPVPLAVRRFEPPVIEADELPAIDVVLLSHDHYDHLEYETCRLLERKWHPLFITTLGTGAHLRYWGIPAERIVELKWHQFHSLAPIRFTALPARHFSGRTLTGRNRAWWASFAIDDGKHRIFFSGDGAYGKHFGEIGRQYGPFDLACIEIDAWNPRWPDVHLFPHRIPAVVRELGAKKLLPIHWAVFDLAQHPWDLSIRQTADLCRRNRIVLLTPKKGETIAPEQPPPAREWWRDVKR